VDAHFGLFGDSSNLDTRTVCAERTIGSKLYWMHPMDLLGDIGYVESRFNPFGDSVSVSAR
jgi:hypothetical protein